MGERMNSLPEDSLPEMPRILECGGPEFADSDLRAVPEIETLQFLSLYDTSVTDAGIRHLQTARCLEEIHVTSDLLTDESLAVICELPKLVSLLISRAPRITDGGLQSLKKRPHLRELYLANTSVGDNGLKYLEGLNTLWSLDLAGTQVTDRGVKELSSLRALSLLTLSGTAVEGPGLAYLRNNENLGLCLDQTAVNDQGVQQFTSRLTQLKHLDLSHTAITDLAAPAIAALNRLNVLKLAGTSISDAGLSAFHNHPNLEGLDVEGCALSRSAILALKKSSRRLTIYGP